MTIEQQLEYISQQTCPKAVDVTDRVMAAVAVRPYLRRTARRNTAWRIALTGAVAASLLAVILNISFTRTRSYNEENIAGMMVQVHEFATSGSFTTIEEAAVNPIESIYED